MYYRLSCKIRIEGDKVWEFNKLVSCRIEMDRETFTDTCTLELPRKVKWQGVSGWPIKRGDKVYVWLGYNDKLTLRFVGYIRDIGLQTPVTISCEDSMYRLKKAAVTKAAYKNIELKELISSLVPGMDIQVDEQIPLGSYRVTADTVSKELDNLRESHGIRSFFKLIDGKPVLFSGVLFSASNKEKTVFKHGLNLISTDLQYKVKDDIKIKVEAISMMPDNTKIKVTDGDADGEIRTLHFYNINKPELEKRAKTELESLKFEGLRGSFKTFGVPEVDKLDRAFIETEEGKKGTYQVQKVVVTFNSAGYKQDITLDKLLSQ